MKKYIFLVIAIFIFIIGFLPINFVNKNKGVFNLVYAQDTTASFSIMPKPTGFCPGYCQKEYMEICSNNNNKPICCTPWTNINSCNYSEDTGKCNDTPEGYCIGNPSMPCDYTVCDFIGLFVNIARIIFALIGTIVLLFFIYASVLLITAAGNPDRIQKGKTTLRNALIGLFIVFFSYEIVGFLLFALLSNEIEDLSKAAKPVKIKFNGDGVGPWSNVQDLRKKCYEMIYD
jgi:hypothetical protein